RRLVQLHGGAGGRDPPGGGPVAARGRAVDRRRHGRRPGSGALPARPVLAERLRVRAGPRSGRSRARLQRRHLVSGSRPLPTAPEERADRTAPGHGVLTLHALAPPRPGTWRTPRTGR